jgi:ferrochelatase
MPYFYAAAPATASANALPSARIGVLIVNLGTPESPTYFAVQRYLREFLSDRRVIDTPRAVWLPLLYGLVLPFRPLKTARNYGKIWMSEGSPLAVYSKRLADKVAALLQSAYPGQVRAALAMTYGNPGIEQAMRRFSEQGVQRLLVLPLYPQYCSATTGSVWDGVTRALRRYRTLPEFRFVNDYHDDPGYIDALAARIGPHLAPPGEHAHLLFSYHGIPAAYAAKGDPYQRHTEATTRLVVKRLGLADQQWSHCYQSRFGRVEWLKPYTVDTIKELADSGVRRLTVASPSFAVDCLETLEEVAIEYRDVFLEHGGEALTLVPALNDDDDHAALLTAIIQRQLKGWI